MLTSSLIPGETMPTLSIHSKEKPSLPVHLRILRRSSGPSICTLGCQSAFSTGALQHPQDSIPSTPRTSKIPVFGVNQLVENKHENHFLS